MMTPRFGLALFGAVWITLLAGCGESPPAAPVEAPPPVGAKPQAPNMVPRVEGKPQQTSRPPVEIPEELAGGEVFEVVKNQPDGQRFAVDRARDLEERDRFALSSLEGNVDSTKFAVAKPQATAAATFKLPEGFTVVNEAGANAEGMPWRITCGKDGSVLVLVPAGPCVIGTNEGAENAAPQHGVYLDDFYIDTLEVTAEQYEKFRDSQRDAKKRYPFPARPSDDPREPVLGVNWSEALQYTRWAGKDLPTEAQWEKAARGTGGFVHPWGNEKYLWQRAREPAQIDKVGSFPGDQSPFGVVDLAGNAREWCADWYSDTTYKQLLASGDSVPRNPTGPKTAPQHNQRVVRGGDPMWRAWSRAGVVGTDRPQDIGIRGVLNPRAPKAR